MSIVVKIPAVGESITEVIVGEFSVNDGDIVELDQVICELESDKATFELNAEAAGKIKILAKEGDTLKVGDAICEIDESNQEGRAKSESGTESESESQSEGEAGASKTGEIKEMLVTSVGESITEVTIGSWIKEDGEFVELDEIICEIESDKATFELPAEANGILEQVAKEGDVLKIGELICKIHVTEGSPVKKEEPTPEAQVEEAKAAAPQPASVSAVSPLAANILADKGIDPSQVVGTGPGGKITKEDAMKASPQEAQDQSGERRAESGRAGSGGAGSGGAESGGAQPALPSGERNQERKRMTNLRKTIAKRLVSVKNETAMLTTFNEVNMKPIMDLRKKYKDGFKEKYGVGLGFMSFFTKACCQALLEIPAVNAQIDGDEIVYNNFCDISIAVSTDRGLVVPVIRNAEQMSFDGIEKEIVNLATKARDGKLTIEEMTGGTFTITNGGIFGSMLSTPIINAPQSAILGMHNIVERPMAVNGEVQILPIMYVAMSYDHRIIDGKESVTFLVRVKELLEDPSRLMLGI